MSEFHGPRVEAMAQQVIKSYRCAPAYLEIGHQFARQVSPGLHDRVDYSVFRKGLLPEIQCGMGPHVQREFAFFQQFIPPPEDKGPGFALEAEPQLGFKAEALAADGQVEHSGRFAKREGGYERYPFGSKGNGTGKMHGPLAAIHLRNTRLRKKQETQVQQYETPA